MYLIHLVVIICTLIILKALINIKDAILQTYASGVEYVDEPSVSEYPTEHYNNITPQQYVSDLIFNADDDGVEVVTNEQERVTEQRVRGY